MNYTTNLNLKKPGYGDTADIEDINDNMDTLDTFANGMNTNVSNINNNIAIVSTNGKAPKAIISGQFVIFNGVLCAAKSDISANTTLSTDAETGNLRIISDGGMNDFMTYLGTFSTASGAETAIADFCKNMMGAHDVKGISLSMSAASTPFSAAQYSGTVYRVANQRYHVMLCRNASWYILFGASIGSESDNTFAWNWTEVETGNRIAKVQGGLTASENISKGDYVIWRNYGLRVAASNITSGTELSTTNLASTGSAGGLNHLKNQMASTIGNIAQYEFEIAASKSLKLTSDANNSVFIITTRRNYSASWFGSWIVAYGSATSAPLISILASPGSNISISAGADGSVTLANAGSSNGCYVSAVRIGGAGNLTGTVVQ